MASHRVDGAKQLAVELPAEFVDRFKEWVRARGEKIAPTVMLALERHMAYPPQPVEPPPFEVPPAEGEVKPKGRRKK